MDNIREDIEEEIINLECRIELLRQDLELINDDNG